MPAPGRPAGRRERTLRPAAARRSQPRDRVQVTLLCSLSLSLSLPGRLAAWPSEWPWSSTLPRAERRGAPAATRLAFAAALLGPPRLAGKTETP